MTCQCFFPYSPLLRRLSKTRKARKALQFCKKKVFKGASLTQLLSSSRRIELWQKGVSTKTFNWPLELEIVTHRFFLKATFFQVSVVDILLFALSKRKEALFRRWRNICDVTYALCLRYVTANICDAPLQLLFTVFPIDNLLPVVFILLFQTTWIDWVWSYLSWQVWPTRWI